MGLSDTPGIIIFYFRVAYNNFNPRFSVKDGVVNGDTSEGLYLNTFLGIVTLLI